VASSLRSELTFAGEGAATAVSAPQLSVYVTDTKPAGGEVADELTGS